MDMTNIDLNASAFGTEDNRVGSTSVDADVDAESKVPNLIDEQVTEVSEETKVPYSRFKKFHDEAIQLREEAAEWKARAEQAISSQAFEQPSNELPDYWRRLYGESPEAQEAWKIQKHQNETLIEQARREAVEAVNNQKYQEQQLYEKNVAMIDESFEDLTAILGRDLTVKEENAVLEIVDEYTPKDKNGDYAGAILPIDKAWEIYELKQRVSRTPSNRARDSVAFLSGTSSQGDPGSVEREKNFNPSWGSLSAAIRDRLG